MWRGDGKMQAYPRRKLKHLPTCLELRFVDQIPVFPEQSALNVSLAHDCSVVRIKNAHLFSPPNLKQEIVLRIYVEWGYGIRRTQKDKRLSIAHAGNDGLGKFADLIETLIEQLAILRVLLNKLENHPRMGLLNIADGLFRGKAGSRRQPAAHVGGDPTFVIFDAALR